MERPLSRRRAALLARRRRNARRNRNAARGLARRVRRRSLAVEERQFHRRPRRLHPRRPRLLRPQAQRSERRAQPRRDRRQLFLEPRRRRADRRSRDHRGAGARPAQSLDAAVHRARNADAGDGRRTRIQPGRQQQRLRPGQCVDGDRLGARRRRARAVRRPSCRAPAARIPRCRATPFSPAGRSTQPASPMSNGATPRVR